MERCLFLKEGVEWVAVQVTEDLYQEILCYLKTSNQQVSGLLKPLKSIPSEQKNNRFFLKEMIHSYESEVNSIFVKDKDYFRRINFEWIRWIEASGSYCCLYLVNAPKMILSFNLRELSIHLPQRFFIRVHRSYIVNVNYIDSFVGNMLCIGKDHIPVSKQNKSAVISRLNVLGSVK